MRNVNLIALAMILTGISNSSYALGLHSGSGSRSFFQGEYAKTQQGVAQPVVQEAPAEPEVVKGHKHKHKI